MWMGIYFWVAVVALVLWAVVAAGASFTTLVLDGDVDEFKAMAAVMSSIFVGILIWPFVIPLAVVCFLIYGLTMALKFLVKKEI